MRPATTLVRVTVLVGVAAGLCACAKASPTGVSSSAPASGLPSISSVSGGKFASTVDLDDGGLVVQPPGHQRARLSESAANTAFRAADAVAADYRFAVFGLGLVTIAQDVTGPTSSTAPAARAPAGTTSTAAAGAPGSPTTTNATTSTTARAAATAASSTTTSLSTTTSPPASSAPGTTSTSGPPAASIARYDGRLAWVGIVWGPRCGASPATTTTAARHATGAYVAVIVDANTGRDVVAYTSAGVEGCGGDEQGPHAEAPDELVSVPWSVVGPSSTAVTVSVPPCGSYYGWTEVPTSATTSLQVVARRPYSGCPSTAATTQTVDSVVPLGGAQSQVLHAPLGPVAGLHTLSEG